MNKILLLILLILIVVLIKKYYFTTSNEESFSTNIPTKQIILNIPEVYPMTLEFEYDNMDNIIENDTIKAINELTDIVVKNINKSQPAIIYNNDMRQVTLLKPILEESTEYGKHLVKLLNKAAIYKYYKFVKINNISKEQIDNQMKLNFSLDLIYNSKITKENVPLSFNVVMLFEQLYDDDSKFHNPDIKPDVRSYLETFRLNGLPNRGFLPGVVQK